MTTFVDGQILTAAELNAFNAATATALQTPRAINGVNFDGTASITIQPIGAVLSSDLASTTDQTKGSTLVGWFKSLANFIGRTLSAKLSDQYSVCDYGAVGDSATNNATFLANCPATDLLVPPGTYLVNSNTTIAANLRFAAGAILKPANGVTITLGAAFSALPTQIFDLSAGGLVALPQAVSTVCAEWWGALAFPVVYNNNEVPINAAIQALAVTVAGVSGGTVTLERGDFFTLGTINLHDNIDLVGKGKQYTLIKAAADFSVANMVLAKNGTSSMFNCMLRNLRLDANDNGGISAVIYAPAWQQKSGTDDVYISNFKQQGIQLDTGYGGATQLKLRRTEIFAAADCVPGSNCIYADYSVYSVGWFSLTLNEVQCGSSAAAIVFTAGPASGSTSATLAAAWPSPTGAWNVAFSTGETRAVTLTNGATTATWSGGLSSNETATASGTSPNARGMYLKGRTLAIAQDIHFENVYTGIEMHTGAKVVGSGIKPGGNSDVTNLFVCAGDWTGTINASGVEKSGAAVYIADSNRAVANYPQSNIQPFDDQLVWPPNAGRPVGQARITGGASPVISWQQGPITFSVAHTITGRLDVTISPTFNGAGNYYVEAVSGDSGAPIAYAENQTASLIYVFTRTGSGVSSADSSILNVRIYGAP